jgi:chemotaxis signal transduction protein
MREELALRVMALREAFDRSFATPQANAVESVDFIMIRVDEAPYAIGLADIAALSASGRITAIPGQPAALLGLAGFRGAMLPVYGLAALLGHGTAPVGWLVRTSQMAFGFSWFEGHLRLPTAQILPQREAAAALRHVSGFLQYENHTRPVLDMASLFAAVVVLAGGTMKEEGLA